MEHSRRNPRLACFDYASTGVYFVTICTDQRRKILSKVCRDDPCGRPRIHLLPLGKIAENMIPLVEKKYHIAVDYYVIMPDHIHMIIFLPGNFVQGRLITLGQVIGGYTSLVSNQWLNVCKQHGVTMGKLWQNRYYDHIVRNDEDLANTRSYIKTNPDRWVMNHSN